MLEQKRFGGWWWQGDKKKPVHTRCVYKRASFLKLPKVKGVGRGGAAKWPSPRPGLECRQGRVAPAAFPGAYPGENSEPSHQKAGRRPTVPPTRFSSSLCEDLLLLYIID